MKSRWMIHVLRSQLPSQVTCLPSFKHSFANKVYLSFLDVSRLLSLCGKKQYLILGSSIHASVVKNFEFHCWEGSHVYCNALLVWNSLLSMYCKCGHLREAHKLFDDMPMRDTVSWNIMLSSFFDNHCLEKGFSIFRLMHEFGCYGLDKATITTVLSVCGSRILLCATRMIHCLVMLMGYEQEITVGNSLITSYFKSDCSESGMRVFYGMFERNVVTWTSVISGNAQNQISSRSLQLFCSMKKEGVHPNALTYLSSLMACSGLKVLETGCQVHGLIYKSGFNSDMTIRSGLMDMYSKCGIFKHAWKIFESAEDVDEITMTVILVGFVRNGFMDDAIKFFADMVRGGVRIDADMSSSILAVFAHDTSITLGKQLHCFIVKQGFYSNPFVNNGLINMYSKCGELSDSRRIFDHMPFKTLVSWNSMIAAFARHDGILALEFYEDMINQGVQPTDVTFVSLLHACSHLGLIDKGMDIIDYMMKLYGIAPRMEHYACIVDMLGRAGRLEEARIFIEELPEKPGVLVWQALLGACGFYGDCELGKYAADHLIFLQPENPSTYILLGNIYSSRGKWKERAGIIKRMKELGLEKDTGISWIEVNKKIHSFVVGEKLHPMASGIHRVLDNLLMLMIDEDTTPGISGDKSKCLHD